jgi:hypothetical protein
MPSESFDHPSFRRELALAGSSWAAAAQLSCRNCRRVPGPSQPSASGCRPADGSCRALPREQEGGKAGRSAGERERIFVFGGPKPKIFPLEASRRFLPASWREAREPPMSRFPPSRLPVVTCSIVRGGPDSPRKLLRLGLRIGSQRSFAGSKEPGARKRRRSSAEACSSGGR